MICERPGCDRAMVNMRLCSECLVEANAMAQDIEDHFWGKPPPLEFGTGEWNVKGG